MAVHVLRRFAELATYAHQPVMAERARQHADKLADAVRACWRGRHLNRGWRDRNHEVGYKDLYLEPQPWALISGVLDQQQNATLVDEITHRLADPIGSRIFGAGGEGNPPTAFGGEWLSINSTLVWGLSKVSPERAWRELVANTLFNHARTYPSVWFGIWSGPGHLFALQFRPSRRNVDHAALFRSPTLAGANSLSSLRNAQLHSLDDGNRSYCGRDFGSPEVAFRLLVMVRPRACDLLR